MTSAPVVFYATSDVSGGNLQGVHLQDLIELCDLQNFADVGRRIVQMDLHTLFTDRGQQTQQAARYQPNPSQVKGQNLAVVFSDQFHQLIATFGNIHVVEDFPSPKPNDGQFSRLVNFQRRNTLHSTTLQKKKLNKFNQMCGYVVQKKTKNKNRTSAVAATIVP